MLIAGPADIREQARGEGAWDPLDDVVGGVGGDPRFASAVRAADPRVHYRRRIAAAALGFLAGVGLLLAGVVVNLIWIAVAGFIVMVACTLWAVTRYRRMTGRATAADKGPGDKRRAAGNRDIGQLEPPQADVGAGVVPPSLAARREPLMIAVGQVFGHLVVQHGRIGRRQNDSSARTTHWPTWPGPRTGPCPS